MDDQTRDILFVLGWRSCMGKDGGGKEYEGWTRLYDDGRKPSYFHIYHEAVEGETIRPIHKERK